MRQAIMTSPGVIEQREIPEPGKLKDNEILLRIARIGVCGSDIHVFHGKHPATPYPVVQGHEYSAVVEAVGHKVTKVKPGMRATARPQLVCGECGPCKRGQYNACQKLKVQGFQAPGVAQDLFVVPEDRIIAFSDSMTFEQGAMIEPAAVGAHSTNRVSGLNGKNVVVAGAGTIGNLVAQFAKARGAAKVLITDISDYRLNIARQCGIEGTLNVKDTHFEEEVKSYFGNKGFQVGFEAAGVQASLDVLMQFVEKGGEIVILGVYSQNPVVNMFYLGEHELNVFGSMMYRHEDYEAAVEMIASGKIITTPLISRSFPFSQYLDAYKFIEEQGDRSMKVMIEL
ncbi:MAG: alcohol dehydrogenase catalytic domain-containing protein [Bacteroidia bacterium]|nr:alcohol dehydrogenase catalytic domain-containing protein [Bacteroidia bacterium]